jgi:MFS family permease
LNSNFISAKEMTKGKKLLFKFVLLLIVIDTMAGAAVINPAMGEFTKAFPGVSPTLINFITTIPSLVAIPIGILAGKLAEKYNKKTLALIAFAFYLVGGIAPAFATGIYGILVLRGIMGIGMGMLNPLSMAMIADMFDGEDRAKMMGYGPAAGSVFGLLMGMLGGYLAGIKYNYVFFGFIPLIIIPIIVYFVLPKDLFWPKAKPSNIIEVKKEEVDSNLPKEKIPGVVWGLTILNFLSGICTVTFMMRFAVYFMEENLGSPLQIGMIMSGMMFASILAGVVFGPLYKKIKYYIICATWMVFVVGGLVLIFAPSITGCIIAQICFGIGGGWSIPFFNMAISAVTPRAKRTMAIAIVGLGTQIGMFVSSFATSAILMFMPSASTRIQYWVPTIGFLILTCFGAMFAHKYGDKAVDLGTDKSLLPPM